MTDEQILEQLRAKNWELLSRSESFPLNTVALTMSLLTEGAQYDKDYEVRELAVHTAHATLDPKASDVMFKALHDDNDIVKAAAARFLESHCSVADIPKLIAQLRRNGDDYVREQIALLLGKLNQSSAVKPLQKQIQIENWPEAREAMALALARLGDEEQEKYLISRLTHDDPIKRGEAARDMLYVSRIDLTKNLAQLLNDKRDAMNVGPSHGELWIRVCDVAVNVLDELLEHPFAFDVSFDKRYSDEELQHAFLAIPK